MKLVFLRILRKTGLLPHLNLALTTLVNGRRFTIPVIRGIGIDHFYQSEVWMDKVIVGLTAQKDGSFVDVGANIGQTLLKVKSLKPNVTYLGFEPNPECTQYLNQLLGLNPLGKITIYPVGIFSFDGLAQLFLTSGSKIDSCATLIKNFREIAVQPTHVPVISGSSLALILKDEISIIKIDVEGAELEVLQQLEGVIERTRPFIICEILPAYSNENTFRIERHGKISEWIWRYKYVIYNICGGKLRRLDSIPSFNSIEESNYIFVPVEVLQNFDPGILLN